MNDIKTMDNINSAAILSIGAVQCDLTTGKTGKEYYRVIDLKGQPELGLTLNAETIYWWLGQSRGATEALLVGGKILLTDMCISFNKWLQSLEGNTRKYRMWGNGASFDNAILRHAYRRCEIEFPIPFWNDRDMRTIPKTMQETWRWNNLREGTHHNALDDAKHQVKYCSHILKELGVEELW